MKEISDDYHLLNRTGTDDIGCLYQYPKFTLDKNDTIAYTFNVTLENNRLNLSVIVRELFDLKECYCTDVANSIIQKSQTPVDTAKDVPPRRNEHVWRNTDRKQRNARNELYFLNI